MAGIGEPVGKFRALGDKQVGHPVPHHDAADGQVAGRQPLGYRRQVRLQAVIIGTEPGPKPAETADHLIRDQQHVVFPADALNFRPVAFRRHDQAAGALDRFPDKRGHPVRAQRVDFLFQPARARGPEFLRGHIVPVPVPVGRGDMPDAGYRQAALLVHRLHPAQAGGGNGAAVVGVFAADEHLLFGLPGQVPVTPHQPEHRVVGLGTGVGKKDVVKVRRGNLRQQPGQLNRRGRGSLEEIIVIGQLKQLPVRRVGQLLPAVTDVDAPQAGHAVQQSVTVRIPDINTVGAGNHPATFLRQGFGIGKRVQVVGAVGGLPVRSIHGKIVPYPA